MIIINHGHHLGRPRGPCIPPWPVQKIVIKKMATPLRSFWIRYWVYNSAGGRRRGKWRFAPAHIMMQSNETKFLLQLLDPVDEVLPRGQSRHVPGPAASLYVLTGQASHGTPDIPAAQSITIHDNMKCINDPTEFWCCYTQRCGGTIFPLTPIRKPLNNPTHQL